MIIQMNTNSLCCANDKLPAKAIFRGYNNIKIAYKSGVYVVAPLFKDDNTANLPVIESRYVLIGNPLDLSIIYEIYIEGDCNQMQNYPIVAKRRYELPGAIKIFVSEGYENAPLTKTPEFQNALIEGRVVYLDKFMAYTLLNQIFSGVA